MAHNTADPLAPPLPLLNINLRIILDALVRGDALGAALHMKAHPLTTGRLVGINEPTHSLWPETWWTGSNQRPLIDIGTAMPDRRKIFKATMLTGRLCDAARTGDALVFMRALATSHRATAAVTIGWRKLYQHGGRDIIEHWVISGHPLHEKIHDIAGYVVGFFHTARAIEVLKELLELVFLSVSRNIRADDNRRIACPHHPFSRPTIAGQQRIFLKSDQVMEACRTALRIHDKQRARACVALLDRVFVNIALVRPKVAAAYTKTSEQCTESCMELSDRITGEAFGAPGTISEGLMIDALTTLDDVYSRANMAVFGAAVDQGDTGVARWIIDEAVGVHTDIDAALRRRQDADAKPPARAAGGAGAMGDSGQRALLSAAAQPPAGERADRGGPGQTLPGGQRDKGIGKSNPSAVAQQHSATPVLFPFMFKHDTAGTTFVSTITCVKKRQDVVRDNASAAAGRKIRAVLGYAKRFTRPGPLQRLAKRYQSPARKRAYRAIIARHMATPERHAAARALVEYTRSPQWDAKMRERADTLRARDNRPVRERRRALYDLLETCAREAGEGRQGDSGC